MVDLHDQLGPFLDGELSPADAEAFRRHLASCAACQRDLVDFTALDAVAGAQGPAVAPRGGEPSAPPRGPAGGSAPVRPGHAAWPAPPSASAAPDAPIDFVARRPRRHRAVGLAVAAGALLAASVAAFFVFSRRATTPPPAARFALAPERQLEARVTWRPADAWRPYAVSRAAGAAREPLPAAVLADLEAQGDSHALAGAWLVAGDAARAKALLASAAGAPADVASDRAAVALSEGHAEDALALAQAALDVAPGHPQATWNRALALEALGLDLAAAQAYRATEALGEAGWADEAGRRARALEASWQKRMALAQKALDAGAAMVLGGPPMPVDLALVMPSWARMNVRYALLTAPSRQAVQALAPLARTLDGTFGGHVLEDAVARQATQDFTRRAGWARGFRGVVVDYYRAIAALGFGPRVPGDEPGLGAGKAALVGQLRAARAWDYLVLALPMTGSASAAFDDYAAAARAVGDPWFDLAVELERARRAPSTASTEAAWKALAPRAAAAPLRALQVHEALANLYLSQHRVVEASTHALEALKVAQGQSDFGSATRLLNTLADAARFRNASALAAAFLEEGVLRAPGDCAQALYRRESLAAMAVVALDAAGARRELDQVPECAGAALSVVGLNALADVARMAPRDGDLPRFEAALATLTDDDAPAFLRTHLRGRMLLDVRPAEGARLLRAAIAEAAKHEDDGLARKARAYGYGLLRVAAGEAGRWDDVLALTEEETGAGRLACALVVEAQDDRVVVASRDARGAATGAAHRFPPGRREAGLSPDDFAKVAGPVATAAAQACPVLSVFAGFPLHGRAGWLPDELAWTYAGGGRGGRPTSPSTLVVRDVTTPAALGLPRLASWQDVAPPVAPGDVELVREAATPARVKEAMRRAGFIELHAHALVNAAEADTAALVLAAGPDGAFALSARELEQVTLDASPVVLLAACRASTVAPFMHEPWSLPRALLRAGAAAVIAAPVDVPDGEARAFFDAVARRVKSGEDAAQAVRAERLEALRRHRAPWVRAVLVFE